MQARCEKRWQPKWIGCVALGLWLTACGSRSSLEGAAPDQTSSGGRSSGGRSSGGQNSGGQSSGGQNSGGESSGGQNTGGQNTGGQNTGGQNTGGGSGCPEGYIDDGGGCQPLLTDLWTFEGTVDPAISPTRRSYLVTVPIWSAPLYLIARFPQTANTHITPYGGDESQIEEMLYSQPWLAPSQLPGHQSFFDLVVSEAGYPSTWYILTLYREGRFHYIKASNTDAGDAFGYRVAVSADGLTLAVGTPGESSGATGVNGNQNDESASGAGAVYVLTWDNQSWLQQAYLKASNPGTSDGFGSSVDLSSDGNVLIVGAPSEASGATGVNGDQLDDSASGAGAAYVFSRSGEVWQQEAYLKASNTGPSDGFGTDVAVAADGNTLAVGAPNEFSSARGVDGDQSLNDAYQAGAVYVFSRSSGTIAQEAYIKASNATGEDRFGMALDLSSDGNALVVGAPYENSFASGIDGDQLDFGASAAGAVYSFTRQASTWSQDTYIKANPTSDGAVFGSSVSLSGDGSTLAVGAYGEINDPGQSGVGTAYVLLRSATSWTYESYLKGTNIGPEVFGWSVALSDDGNVLVVGAPHDGSPAAGINGDPFAEPIKIWAGAAYRFVRDDSYWGFSAYIKSENPNPLDLFGATVGVTHDGKTVVVGASGERSAATGVDGDAWNSDAPGSGAVFTYKEE